MSEEHIRSPHFRDKLSEVKIEELRHAVLTRQNAIIPFAKALDSAQHIPADNAIHISRLVETSSINNGELLAALGRLVSDQRSPRSMDQLDLLIEQSARGNISQGREIFQRAELTCIKCHAVMGNGGEIGPDLSSIGAAALVDYLIESLLAPSSSGGRTHRAHPQRGRTGEPHPKIKNRGA